ncbi:MAG: energy transducer TonB [Candidatus Omnitrophica bacterium]|nr:energy transducer TonB [Candidatus Omnitrophota bacterium]
MEEKIFACSIIVSFLVHLVAIGSLLYANVHYAKKVPREIEVVYHAQAQKAVVEKKKLKVKSVKEKKMAPSPEILEKKGRGPSPVMKDIIKQAAKLKVYKKRFNQMSSLDGKRHVSVPVLKSEKITNPQYLSYHEVIRNKIRNRAYFYIDSPDFQAGSVYLTFVVSSKGELTDLKIIKEKTSANSYLRNAGLQSIKESAPFPPFPRDLIYPELSFNVVISFEVDE